MFLGILAKYLIKGSGIPGGKLVVMPGIPDGFRKDDVFYRVSICFLEFQPDMCIRAPEFQLENWL